MISDYIEQQRLEHRLHRTEHLSSLRTREDVGMENLFDLFLTETIPERVFRLLLRTR